MFFLIASFRSPILPLGYFFSKVIQVDHWSAIFYKIYSTEYAPLHFMDTISIKTTDVILVSLSFFEVKSRSQALRFQVQFFYASKRIGVRTWELLLKIWFVSVRLRSSSIRQIRLSSACAVCVTHMLSMRIFIIECSICAMPRMHRQTEKDDRFSDDQECCIRGLRWPKEANDPDRPANQRRNGSPTPQREGRHQDPEV